MAGPGAQHGPPMGRQPTASQQVPQPRGQSQQGPGAHQRSRSGQQVPAMHMAHSVSPPGMGAMMPGMQGHPQAMQHPGAYYQLGQPVYSGAMYAAAQPQYAYMGNPVQYSYQQQTYYMTPTGYVQAPQMGYAQHPQHTRQGSYGQPGMHSGGAPQQQQPRGPRGGAQPQRQNSQSSQGAPPHAPPHQQQGPSGPPQGHGAASGQQPQRAGSQQVSYPQPGGTGGPRAAAAGGAGGSVPPAVPPLKPVPAAKPRKVLTLTDPSGKDLSAEIEKARKETEAKEAKAKKEAPVVPAPLRDVAPAAKVGQAAPVAGPPGANSGPVGPQVVPRPPPRPSAAIPIVKPSEDDVTPAKPTSKAANPSSSAKPAAEPSSAKPATESSSAKPAESSPEAATDAAKPSAAAAAEGNGDAAKQEAAAKADAEVKAKAEADAKAEAESVAKQKAQEAAVKEAAAKAAAEKEAADKAAAEKAASEKAAAEKAATEEAAADKAAADKAAADKAAADRAAEDKAAADSAAAAQAEKEEDEEVTSEAAGDDTAQVAAPQSAKARRKEMLARANDKGTGGEMDAYTTPKPEAPKSEPAPAPAAKPAAPLQTKPSIVSHPVPLSREASTVDDWEASDATPARLPAPSSKAASSPSDGPAAPTDRRYSRDWLVAQQFRNTSPPKDLERMDGVHMPFDDLRRKQAEDMPRQQSMARGGSNPFGGAVPARQGSMAADFGRGGPPGMAMGGRGGPGRGGPQGQDGGQWGHAPMPGGPGRGGPPGMGRAGSMRGAPQGGIESGQWARGTMQPPPMANVPGITLHKAEASYKIGATRTDDPEEEKKQKLFNAQLNKLTPDNFDRILGKLVDVGVTSAKTLRGLIDRIFDKALTEVTFTELYAELCVQLNAKLPGFEDPDAPATDGAKKLNITFRRVLLNKCQEEFEAGDSAMKAVDAREKAAAEKKASGETEEEEEDDDAAAEGDAEKSEDDAKSAAKPEGDDKEEGEIETEKPKETPAQAKQRIKIEEAREAAKEYKARQRMLGNIQFIGQLYNKKMLTDRIMHECIVKLVGEVNKPRQEDVECLCKMLRTSGKNLEEKGERSRMDVYFKRIQALALNKSLDSRVRFALQDLRELRYNQWEERRKADGPKKIAEVHAEAAEQLRQQAAAQRGGPRGRGPPMQDNRGAGRRDMNDYGGPPRGQIGTRMQAPAMRNNDHIDAPLRTMNTAGSAGFSNSLRPGGAPARLGPPSGGAPGGPGGAGRTTSPPTERKALVLKPRSSTALPLPEQTPEGAAAAGGAPSGELAKLSKEAQEKTKSVLREYLRTKDLKESVEIFKEAVKLDGMDLAAATVAWVEDALEQKQGAWSWADVAALLAGLHGAEIPPPLPSPALERGLRHMLDVLPDLAIDVPKAPGLVGGLIGDLAAAGVIDFKAVASHIATAGEPPAAEGEDAGLVDSMHAASVAGAALEHFKAAKGAEAAKAAWAATGVSLKSLLFSADREDAGALQKVVEQHGLEDVV